MMGNEGHFFGGGFMWLFWILIIAGIFFIFQAMAKGSSGNSLPDKESPLEIFKETLCAG